jgi:predicted TIM-barrel fold metal-dependent hydrolase
MLIDCHTHVGPTWINTEPLTPETLLDWMDDSGIDRAVLLPLESPSAASYYSTTRSILDIADDYDRFLPFCSFDPRVDLGTGAFVDSRKAGFRQLIEQYVDRGARGFGEIKCNLPIDDDRMQLIYDLCGEFDLPMLFHLDDQSMMDEVGLPRLERMLESYPDADFIMHSHGWWSHISADVESDDLARGAMPDGPVVEGGRCDELLSEYDNLFADISAGSGWNALIRDEEYTRAFLQRHHEQVLFGTDKSYVGFEPQHAALFDRFSLSGDVRENIAHRNIERLLRP